MKTTLKFDGKEIGTILGRVTTITECFNLLNVSEEDQEGYALQPQLITISYSV